MRLIDADELNIITADVEYHGHANAWKKHNVKIVLANDIKKAPFVEIRHGHWANGKELNEKGIEPPNSDYASSLGVKIYFSDVRFYCSECLLEATWDIDCDQELTDYCPHCGAKMDKVTE